MTTIVPQYLVSEDLIGRIMVTGTLHLTGFQYIFMYKIRRGKTIKVSPSALTFDIV